MSKTVNYISPKATDDIKIRDYTLKELVFYYQDKWIMKIKNGQIHLNRPDFPDLSPDEFSEKFLECLKGSQIIYDFKIDR